MHIYILCVCSISINIDSKRQQNDAVRLEKTVSFSIFPRTTSTKSRKSSLATPCITENFAASGQSKIERCYQWMIFMMMFDDVLCWCFMIVFCACLMMLDDDILPAPLFGTSVLPQIFLSQSEEAVFRHVFRWSQISPSFQSGQCRSVQTKLHWYSPVTGPRLQSFTGGSTLGGSTWWSCTFEAPLWVYPLFHDAFFGKYMFYEGHNHQKSYWNMSLYFRMALKCSLHVSYIFPAFQFRHHSVMRPPFLGTIESPFDCIHLGTDRKPAFVTRMFLGGVFWHLVQLINRTYIHHPCLQMDLELWQVLGIKLCENQCLPFMGYAAWGSS